MNSATKWITSGNTPKRKLPRIQLINLCNQKLHEGMAETLLDQIRQHLQQQGQVLLFINRRGFAPLLMRHDSPGPQTAYAVMRT